jgi:oligosaccharide repeat unit polymerase
MKTATQLNLTNPLMLYALLWGSALGLTSLALTVNLAPMNVETVALVLSTVATFAVAGGLHVVAFPSRDVRRSSSPMAEQMVAFREPVRKLLIIWGLGSALEAALGGGLPLMWIFTGSAKTYADFGVPMLHGLLMSLYMLSTTALYLDYQCTGDRRRLRASRLLLIWPILLMSRGAMIWIVLQIACVHLFHNPVRIGNILKYLAIVLGVIWLFGFIGDLRMGGNKEWMDGLLNLEHGAWIAKLPTGFIWVYLYITASLNNVVTNIQNLQPTYSFYFSSKGLFPSVLRDALFDPSAKYIELAVEAFNTSTFFENFLRDFGVRGTVAVVAVLQLGCIHIYRLARQGEAWALLAYAVCFQALALSVFSDNFTSLPNIAQIGVALLCGRQVQRRLRPAER